MDIFKNYALLALAILVVVLASATMGYRKLYKASDLALQTQNSAIKAQNKQAETLLALRTTERDALQIKLDAKAKAQEKTDEAGKNQITADSKRTAADPVPVRVRYVGCDARRSGGSPAGQGTAPAAAGGGDADTSGGVLASPAAELFKRDQDAVEALQLAFNSCRARVVKE
jgi:hypothetical protein